MAEPIMFEVWDDDGQIGDRVTAHLPRQAAQRAVIYAAHGGDPGVGDVVTVTVRAPDGTTTRWDCAVDLAVIVREAKP